MDAEWAPLSIVDCRFDAGDRTQGVPVARRDRHPEQPSPALPEAADDLHLPTVQHDEEPAVPGKDPHQPSAIWRAGSEEIDGPRTGRPGQHAHEPHRCRGEPPQAREEVAVHQPGNLARVASCPIPCVEGKPAFEFRTQLCAGDRPTDYEGAGRRRCSPRRGAAVVQRAQRDGRCGDRRR